MAQQKRQSNLYAGEDWKQIYEAFRKINLQSYDFDTIRQSMVDYLRTTYPDSFNDWIENDEFIFLLDTISFLGQNLAFRMDLNSRENFLDTAERRSSVLKLAKMISYSPRRAYPARGLAKLKEIKTNQDIRNSSGRLLRGVPIMWNDPLDPEWWGNWLLVMNSSFIASNQFGDPVKQTVSDGIINSIYRMNTIPMSSPSIPFNANVNGESMNFEVVNPDVNNSGVFEERAPEPQMQHHIIYRNDGNGFDSPNTGFFVYFKEGNLSFSDFQYDQPIESRIQEVSKNNINEIDVWVQEITSDGLVRIKWTRVPALESIAYNSVDRKLKNIYSITTRDNDQITLKFPDSRSGNVPRGTYRVWYRVSNGKTYTIKTTDIQNKTIQYIYRSKGQSQYQQSTLDIKFTLQYQVQNAQTKETIDQIKERAPQLYYTQNRFVNGEDYNIAPLMMGNTVLKAKAINRIYSGQSRFIDIVDPTGKYQNTDVFSNDGALYRDYEGAVKTSSVILPSNKSNPTIVIDDIEPLISSNSVIQRYQEFPANTVPITTNQIWTSEFNSKYTSGTYGRLLELGLPVVYEVGTLLNFHNISGPSIWTSVIGTESNGYLILSEPITTSWTAFEFIKQFRVKLSTAEVQQISSKLSKKTDFAIVYNTSDLTWVPVEGTYEEDTLIYNGIELQIFVKCSYTSESWIFTSHGVNYVFVGGDKVRFYFVSTKKVSDISTGTVQSDSIDVLSYNTNPINNTGFSENINFNIIDTLIQENGYLDGSRAIITSSSLDSSGISLNPNQFRTLVPQWTGTDAIKYEQWAFFRTNEDFTINYLNVPNSMFTILDSSWVYTIQNANAETIAFKRDAFTRNVLLRTNTMSNLFSKPSGFVINFMFNNQNYFIEQIVGNNNDRLQNFISNMTLQSDPGPITPEQAFYRAISNMSSTDALENQRLDFYGYQDVSNQYIIKTDARVDVNFHWKHYAPDDNRIDPSKTNIIDMYVLTNSYREAVLLWISQNNGSEFPKPPTSTELKGMFADVETKIVVSDSTIWHSASYLQLFGNTAPADYQANLKVVKTPNSKYSDDEIRQHVIAAINQFFDINNWDFGESFYFTEMSTYIHQQLATDIASIVLVPKNANSKFGELFEIPCESDQLFISTATVDNVIIVNSLAKSNINIGN